MRGLMSDGSLAVGHLILELGEPLLRDPKCLVDGITQVGRLELAKQMTRLMRHHDILVARHGYFNRWLPWPRRRVRCYGMLFPGIFAWRHARSDLRPLVNAAAGVLVARVASDYRRKTPEPAIRTRK